MANNNNGVDVLAWLRANLRSAEGRDVVIPAVAELIEAAQELDEELDGPAIAHRMRAALARVGGAA